MAERKLKSYKFDVGNSNKGPIGMVIRVWAYNKKEAVEIANKCLQANDTVKVYERGHVFTPTAGEVEYCNVYLAPNLTIRLIDPRETEEV
jgi:hypothetical protein